MSASVTFLSWVREGAAAAIAQAETLDSTLAARADFQLGIRLNNSTDVGPLSVRLYGPGDITGIDARQVVRTDPPHLTPDFPPNCMAAVEFDRPDFPWQFTPASPNQKQQLRPWLCLAVIPKSDNVKLQINPALPCPVLEIVANAGKDLPTSHAWVWAHAQISGAGSNTHLGTMLIQNPECSVSRLVCPRKLEPNTSYYACVVPLFEAGRRAGLAETVAPIATLDPAWTAESLNLRLPVYYHWEFRTGGGGDFEALVWLLERRTLPATVGSRAFEANAAATGFPAAGVLGLEGALFPAGAQFPGLSSIPVAFRTATRDLLDKFDTPLNSTEPLPVAFGPPIYGRWHAARRIKLTNPADVPLWLEELNLDPRCRAAAAFGTAVVQDQQEQLMASAWRQIGDIERANALLRQAQLARSGGAAIHQKRLSALPVEALMQITGPAHARILDESVTVASTASRSALTRGPVSSAFRRATRDSGPLARRAGVRSPALLRTMNERIIRLRPAPDGTVATNSVTDASGRFQPFELTGQQEHFLRTVPDAGLTMFQRAFRSAFLPHYAALKALIRAKDRDAGQPPRFPLNEAFRKKLLERFDPDRTVPARVLARIVFPDNSWKPEDPIEPVMAAPDFPAPMYKPLAAISQELLLPGLDSVPRNTIALLQPNVRFIEAYMIGLNHEMNRELLWREFPTDQRGTCFRQFWDPAGRVPPPKDDTERAKLRDLKHIQDWGAASALGSHIAGSGAEAQLVLIIRGELLERYPRSLVYAAKARWVNKLDKSGNVVNKPGGTPEKVREPVPVPVGADPASDTFPEKYPVFQGTLEPDVVFMGFNLVLERARGKTDPADNDPGWFLVFQQQPAEPRFGLDETPATSLQTEWTWRDLSWEHVPRTDNGYIDLDKALVNFPTLTQPAGVSWDKQDTTSAAMAYITLQLPFRMAVHASDLLPPTV